MSALLRLPRIDLEPPSRWPALELLAATVLLEAEGEPDEGKLAVAWVVRTRVDRHPLAAQDPEADLLTAVLLAPMQFSSWNADAEGMRTARLTAPGSRLWEACWKAACEGWWRLQGDPTGGADHYLAEEATRAARPLHDLPSWFAEARVTGRIGKHTFLRLG